MLLPAASHLGILPLSWFPLMLSRVKLGNVSPAAQSTSTVAGTLLLMLNGPHLSTYKCAQFGDCCLVQMLPKDCSIGSDPVPRKLC